MSSTNEIAVEINDNADENLGSLSEAQQLANKIADYYNDNESAAFSDIVMLVDHAMRFVVEIAGPKASGKKKKKIVVEAIGLFIDNIEDESVKNIMNFVANDAMIGGAVETLYSIATNSNEYKALKEIVLSKKEKKAKADDDTENPSPSCWSKLCCCK